MLPLSNPAPSPAPNAYDSTFSSISSKIVPNPNPSPNPYPTSSTNSNSKPHILMLQTLDEQELNKPLNAAKFEQAGQIEFGDGVPETFRILSSTEKDVVAAKEKEKIGNKNYSKPEGKSSLETLKKEESSSADDNRITFGVTIPVSTNPNNNSNHSNMSGNSDKKPNLEDRLFHEVTNLKDKVVHSLENYQQAIHEKKLKNVQQEIRRDFLDISKEFSDLFDKYGELNVSTENNEGVNSSVLKTGGPKEEEINTMMGLINEFVQKFAKVAKTQKEKKEKPKHNQIRQIEKKEEQMNFIEAQRRERKQEKMEQSFMTIKSNNVTAFDFEENLQNLNDTTDISISRISKPGELIEKNMKSLPKNEQKKRHFKKIQSFGFVPKKFIMKYQKNVNLKSNDFNIEIHCTCNKIMPIQVQN
jgi:hypothetical protein